MSSLSIVTLDAASSHVNRVCRWLNEEWGRELGYSLADTLEWCLDVIDAREEALLAAVVDDAVVGTALLVSNDLETEPELTPWLSGLYVPSTHRGHRIGTHLVTAVETAATALGYRQLYLYCRAGALEDFYGSRGWRPVKPVMIDTEPHAVMTKPLAPHA